MSEDNWRKLSTREKLDSIRRDLANLLSGYQALNHRIAMLGQHLGQVEAMASKAAAEVAVLRDQLEKDRQSE